MIFFIFRIPFNCSLVHPSLLFGLLLRLPGLLQTATLTHRQIGSGKTECIGLARIHVKRETVVLLRNIEILGGFTAYPQRVEVLVEKSASAIDPPQDSSETAQDSTTAIQDAFRDARAIRNTPQTHKNSFHDLKGRRFEKQIPYRVMF